MKTVLLTGSGSFCAVNILKSLKQTNKYRIVATDIFSDSAGIFRANVGYLVPQENKNDNKYIDSLLNICTNENIDILIPGFDSELPYIYEAKSRFEAFGTKVLIGNDNLLTISEDKYKLSKFLEANNYPFLKSFHLLEYHNALPFPFVIKPKAGWGQRGFSIIHNKKEFDYVVDSIQDPDNYMVQEYIDETEGEYTNSVSVATDYDILGCICAKRELVKGSSRKIIVDEYPYLKEQLIAIAKTIHSPGPINFQCRLRSGKAFIFEINARFSTINSVRAVCGYNEVDILVDNFLTGNKTFIDSYQKKMAIAYFDYVFVDPNDVDVFAASKRTTASGQIYNWL